MINFFFSCSAEAFPKKDSTAYAPPVFHGNMKCGTSFKQHSGKEITLAAGAVDMQKSRQAVLCGHALTKKLSCARHSSDKIFPYRCCVPGEYAAAELLFCSSVLLAVFHHVA